MTDIDRLGIKYVIQGVFLVALLFLISLAVIHAFEVKDVFNAVLVSSIFSLVLEMADGFVWRIFAKQSSESLTTYYTFVSGFRMLAALFTMLCFYVVNGSESMAGFILSFAPFYVLLLAHHSIYFSGVSNKLYTNS